MKKIMHILQLYEKRDRLKKELKEIQEKLRKLRKRKIQLWLLKCYLKIYKKYKFKWVEYQEMAKLFKSNPRKASSYFEFLRKAKLIERKINKKDKRKSLYRLKSLNI